METRQGKYLKENNAFLKCNIVIAAKCTPCQEQGNTHLKFASFSRLSDQSTFFVCHFFMLVKQNKEPFPPFFVYSTWIFPFWATMSYGASWIREKWKHSAFCAHSVGFAVTPEGPDCEHWDRHLGGHHRVPHPGVPNWHLFWPFLI